MKRRGWKRHADKDETDAEVGLKTMARVKGKARKGKEGLHDGMWDQLWTMVWRW